jgi:serine/threonine protein kinase
VVYEMVTGRKAFEGQSQASVIAAILEHEPPSISSLQRMAPPALDRAVKKCLAKDPEERWQNAQDLRDELKWIAEGSLQPGVPAPVAVRRKRRMLLSWALVSILATALLTLATIHLREPPADVSRVVFAVPRPTPRYPLGFRENALRQEQRRARMSEVVMSTDGPAVTLRDTPSGRAYRGTGKERSAIVFQREPSSAAFDNDSG